MTAAILEQYSDLITIGSLVMAAGGGCAIAFGQKVYEQRRRRKMVAGLHGGIQVVVLINDVYHLARVVSYCRTERVCFVRMPIPAEPIRLVAFDDIHFVMQRP